MSKIIHPSSFRDPSGYIFSKNDTLYRQINEVYRENFDHLMNSGLYKRLTDLKLLIAHVDVDIKYAIFENAYKIISPELVPHISYPYEWCFSQLRDVALTTLKIQKIALEFGMVLKDCSAFNVQFIKNKPVFIDTLSFEKYKDGQPWVAYRQFCQHFLAPLALMGYTDIRLNQLFKIYIDGIPLDLASLLLPASTRFKFSLLTHIHLHAKSQKHYSNKTINTKNKNVNRISLLGIIDSLNSAINKMKWKPKGTEWGDYYCDTNYSVEAFENKKKIVEKYLDKINPKNVWDLGGNLGIFSRLASTRGIQTISFDIDPAAIEKNYLECTAKKEEYILPCLLDLTNPSPGIGWENRERMSLTERGPVDMVFLLAFIHHLAISNNLPFNKVAGFLNGICKYLIIEFIPKDDSQIQKLLSNRTDIFSNYTQSIFENEFTRHFKILNSLKIQNSNRTLYLMMSLKS